MDNNLESKNLQEKAAAVLARAKASGTEDAVILSGNTGDGVVAPAAPSVIIAPTEDTPHVVSRPQYTEEELASMYGSNDDGASYAPPPPQEEVYMPPVAPQPPAVTEPEKQVVGQEDEILLTSAPSSGTEPQDETIILSTVAMENMPNTPEDARQNFLDGLMPDIKKYKKELILDYGMTPEEANAAALSRVKAKAIEADRKWAEEHPNGVIVTINKEQEKNLTFSEDEKAKMLHANAIKLVVVDSTALETIRIIEDKTIKKMSHLRDISGAMSHYSVPLLSSGDFATFRGAQTSALLNAITDKDDTWMDMLEKKASVVFRYFDGATVHSKLKLNDKGEEIPITYEDFCNWFHYGDLDIALYAIVVASSMEQTKSTYRCQNRECNQFFDITYNNKSMLDLSNLPEVYKNRISEIDDNRNSMEKLGLVVEKCGQYTRVMSPFSKNIFELHSPTIADARARVAGALAVMDQYNALNLFLLLYAKKIYFYDAASDAYIPPFDTDEDPAEAYKAIENLHQVDLDLINMWINENLFYQPEFKLSVTCPHCKRSAVDNLSVNSMLFLLARASSTEIQY